MSLPVRLLIAVALLAAGCGAAPGGGGAAARPPTPTATPSAPAVAATPTVLASPISMPTVAQLSAPADRVVWALVGGVELFRSTDRGDTWDQRPLPPDPGAKEISFVDDHEGWVVSIGSTPGQCQSQPAQIWHTVDAGVSWLRLDTSGIGDAGCKGALSFVDAGRGFLPAWDGSHAPIIYRTADGGRTWAASRPLPDPPGFTTGPGGHVLTPGQVHAFGSSALVAAGQYVFRSADGETWTYLAATPGGPTPIAFATATRWLEVQPGRSQETLDGGATWHTYTSDYSQAAGVAPEVVFAGSQVGYATVRGALQRTVNGGMHWDALHTPGTTP